jgi:group I intron endonuclease
MEKVCGVYAITNIINNKKYIGQSIDIYVRWRNHKSALKHNRHNNEHLQSAWNTYGEENFIFEILAICDVDKIDDIEQYYIALFNCMNNAYGYNRESGGHNNRSLSEESRKKISDKHRGVKLTDEHKQKIGLAGKGRVLSEVSRDKIREAITGIKRSDETRERITNSRKGENSWCRRSVYCIELNEMFASIENACQKYGFNSSSLCSHLQGRYKWSGRHPETNAKLHWVYTDSLSDNLTIQND